MYCAHCGNRLEDRVKFCVNCGAPQGSASGVGASQRAGQTSTQSLEKELLNKTKGVAENLAEKMNVMSGGEGSVELRFKDFFSNVFVKHTQDEADDLFACGSKSTTPGPESISTEWPKPWLYSRVFLMMGIAYALLLLMYQLFQMKSLAAGIIVVGSFVVPVSVMVFFFEVNAPRNVSFLRVLSIFFVGGLSSMFVTLLLRIIFPSGEMTYAQAILTGIVEETAKLVIVALYISRRQGDNYILNGLLYGAAVGAGFDAFESTTYSYNIGIQYGADAMLEIIYGRSFTALGAHIVWAGIAGAAIMIVKKNGMFSWEMLLKREFLMIIIWPVAMHAVWDMPFSLPTIGPFQIKYLLLIAVAWIMVVVLLNRGLAQINQLRDCKQKQNTEG